MIRRNLAIAGVVALAVVWGLSLWRANDWAVTRTETRYERQFQELRDRRDALLDEVTDKETARLALEQERAVLARQLESEAHADPNAARVAIGADSVRRLNRR